MFMQNAKRLLFILGTLIIVATLGCSTEQQPSASNTPPLLRDESGFGTLIAALSVDLDGDTDVTGFRIWLTARSCADEPFEPARYVSETDFEDMRLSGNTDGFEGSPFDPSSGHIFADNFEVVRAGCYDILAQPIDTDGHPSEDCASAQFERVEVLDGLTTEVVLISQCEGEAYGSIDNVVALNHPPAIVELIYDPSKFVFDCERTIVCVTFEDPEGDPLEIVWSPNNNPVNRERRLPIFEGPEVIQRFEDGDLTTECIAISASGAGTYELIVKAYDLGFDRLGRQVRMETLLTQQGDPLAESRDQHIFPVHVRLNIEMFCVDPATDDLLRLPGVREPRIAQCCEPVEPADYYCNLDLADNVPLTCPDGIFDPTSVFDICDF